jgi:Rix1 complex component involved in 60S ribosome maturation
VVPGINRVSKLTVDAVVSLHNHLSQNLTGSANSTSLSPLITHLAPLILDTSSSVRSAVLELLADLSPQIVPNEALQAHLSMLLLYIQSAMTHIQSDIRSDSTKFLNWTLDIGGSEVVRASWTKVLDSYAGLLGWTVGGRETSRIQLARGSSILGNVNVTARHVRTLFSLLSIGLSETSLNTKRSRPKIINYLNIKSMSLQHPLIECYLPPTHSDPFSYLNLFNSRQTDLQLSSHDVPSRRTQFESYLSSLLVYLHDLSAEVIPSNLSRQPNQTVIDDLQITIVQVLGLIKRVYIDIEMEDQLKQLWKREWKQCISKISVLVDARTQTKGSRKLVREWELANISNI